MTRREITGRKPGVTAGLIRGRKGDDNGEESDQDEADALARKRTTEVSPQETTTIEVAAKRLRIGRNQAYEAARRGELPVIRIGKRLLVITAALNRMLGGQTAKQNVT